MASIKKQGNSYRVQICLGRDADGKQITRSRSYKCDPALSETKNRKAVEEFARAFEKECKLGICSDGNAKLQEVIERYFIDFAEKKLKPQTIHCYRQYVDIINRNFGFKRINEIRATNIQAFVNNLCESESVRTPGKKISGKTVYNYIGFLSSVFRYAITQGIVDANPCANVILPKKTHKEVEVYSLEEMQSIITALQSEAFNRYMIIVLAVYCGFRRGEIYGLEWSDINWEAGTITINRSSLYNSEDGVYTSTPKTEKSKRCLRVPSGLLSLLREYWKWQMERRMQVGPEWVSSDRLFTMWNGAPESPQNIENWWHRFCVRKGFRELKFHSLRHFNATQLIANGADIKTVSTSLGHSSITTTLNIYDHSIAEQQAKASQAVADNIGIDLTAVTA